MLPTLLAADVGSHPSADAILAPAIIMVVINAAISPFFTSTSLVMAGQAQRAAGVAHPQEGRFEYIAVGRIGHAVRIVARGAFDLAAIGAHFILVHFGVRVDI